MNGLVVTPSAGLDVECAYCRQFHPREDVTIVNPATGLALCRKCRPMWRCSCGRVEFRTPSMEQRGLCSECAGVS